jgi:hypothetical protein
VDRFFHIDEGNSGRKFLGQEKTRDDDEDEDEDATMMMGNDERRPAELKDKTNARITRKIVGIRRTCEESVARYDTEPFLFCPISVPPRVLIGGRPST